MGKFLDLRTKEEKYEELVNRCSSRYFRRSLWSQGILIIWEQNVLISQEAFSWKNC